MFKTVEAVRPSHAGGIMVGAGVPAIARVCPDELARLSKNMRPMTVLIAQRNRGGLTPWTAQTFRPDVVVSVNHGDEAALAVEVCARHSRSGGWPVVCIVMGAAHAYARIEVAARKAYGASVHVIVVEGRS